MIRTLSEQAQANSGLQARVNTLVEVGMNSAIESLATSSLKDSADTAIADICGVAVGGVKDLNSDSESNALRVSISKTTVKDSMKSMSKAGVSAEKIGAAAKIFLLLLQPSMIDLDSIENYRSGDTTQNAYDNFPYPEGFVQEDSGLSNRYVWTSVAFGPGYKAQRFGIASNATSNSGESKSYICVRSP